MFDLMARLCCMNFEVRAIHLPAASSQLDAMRIAETCWLLKKYCEQQVAEFPQRLSAFSVFRNSLLGCPTTPERKMSPPHTGVP